ARKGWPARSESSPRPGQTDRKGPLSQPHRSAADRTGKDLSLRYFHRADGASLQERQPHAAGNRQRRLGDHRRAVDALLPAEQDRDRHDLSFGGASLRAHFAGDGRRVKLPPLIPAEAESRFLPGSPLSRRRAVMHFSRRSTPPI